MPRAATSHFSLRAVAPSVDDMQSGTDVEAAFRDAMARFPAAVTVVATGNGEGRRGFTATAVFSVSMTPPMLGVCVNKGVEAHNLFTANRSFCINVLAREQEAIANRFAARDGSKGAMRFEQDEWETLATRAPALASAVASIDCVLTTSLDVGTHTLFLGEVMAVRLNPHRQPVVYFDRKFAGIDPVQQREVPIAVSPIDGW